jgi:hypothetical protein
MKHCLILIICSNFFLNKVDAQVFIKKSLLYFNQYDNKYYNNGNAFTGFALNKSEYSNDTIEYRDGIENGLVSRNHDNLKQRYFSKNGCLQDGFAIIGDHRGYFKSNRPIGLLVSYARKGTEYIEDVRQELGLSVSGGGTGSISALDKVREKFYFNKDTVKQEKFYGSGNLYERNIFIIDTLFYNKEIDTTSSAVIYKKCTDWFFANGGENSIEGFNLEKYIRLNNGYPLRKSSFYEGNKFFTDANYDNGVFLSSFIYLRNGKIVDSLINLDLKNSKRISSGIQIQQWYDQKPDNYYHVKYDIYGKLEFRIKNNRNEETGDRYTYYSNGKLRLHNTLNNGYNVAPMEYYSEDGVLLMKHYKEGGEYFYIENFPDGKIKIKIKTEYNMHDSRGNIIGLPNK